MVRPDTSRLEPLRRMLPPHDLKSQERAVGLFSYYSQWISKFSDKINPIVRNRIFPLPEEAVLAFNHLKRDLESAAIGIVQPSIPLVVETDASDVAIGATLNQGGRPVAFFSRTLQSNDNIQPLKKKLTL